MVSVNATDDYILDLQDQVQSVGRMVSWLVSHAGGDPDEISRVPAGPEDAPQAA